MDIVQSELAAARLRIGELEVELDRILADMKMNGAPPVERR